MQKIKKYFIAANDQLLCTSDGQLILLEEQEFYALVRESSFQYSVAMDDANEFLIAAIDNQEIEGYQWLNLRAQLGVIPEADFQLAGRALQILRWHYDHQYCGRCGKLTVHHEKDLAKTCLHCKLDVYPRLSPCIITLVVRDDYCLLAQHKRSTNGTHSCLAGFIEMGESPEQTLAREVMEEVNISVKNIRYITSQPWPFPGQLMLGYFADYADGDILADTHEILTANWYRYDQLPKVPTMATISGRLIDSFVQQRRALHST